MNIGEALRIIQIEPVDLPIPEVIPEPTETPAPDLVPNPRTPVHSR